GEPYDTGLAPRVAAVLDDIVKKGEDCAVFSHNGPLCFAVTHLLGLPMETASRFYLRHGCYTLIEIDPQIWNERHALLRHFNC
ncbi:MAG: histidine phosphatase family protein, partial [Clostridia bacterium]|nr:histidine phosphatase family protein [Clostridia bacterium]